MGSCGAGTGQGPACRGPAAGRGPTGSAQHHDHPPPGSSLPSHQVRNDSEVFEKDLQYFLRSPSWYLRCEMDNRQRYLHRLRLDYFIRRGDFFFFNPETHQGVHTQNRRVCAPKIDRKIHKQRNRNLLVQMNHYLDYYKPPNVFLKENECSE